MGMEPNTDRKGDLEVKDDGPDQTQGQLGVPICDVVISNVHQLDLERRIRECRMTANPKTEIMQSKMYILNVFICNWKSGRSLWVNPFVYLYIKSRVKEVYNTSYLSMSQEIQCYLYIL